jgi:hypothetical protein
MGLLGRVDGIENTFLRLEAWVYRHSDRQKRPEAHHLRWGQGQSYRCDHLSLLMERYLANGASCRHGELNRTDFLRRIGGYERIVSFLYSMGVVIATGCLHAIGMSIGTFHRWAWERHSFV